MYWKTIITLCITFGSFTIQAQILDTLLKKHRMAMGNEQACTKMAPYKATYVYETASDKTELEVYRGTGNQLRVNKKYFYRGQAIQPQQNFFELINEQGGWSRLPDQNDSLPRRLSTYEINQLLEIYDWADPLIDPVKRNIRLDYLSTEYFNETFYHKILVFYPNGKQEYIFLHPETFLIDRRIINDPSINDDKSITEYRVLLNNCRWPAIIEMGDSRLRLLTVNPQAIIPASVFKLPTNK